jgi:phosphoglycolate phosphatase
MNELPADLRALIFDFDGTLATGAYDFQAMRERVHALAARYGVAPRALEGLYALEAVERAAGIIGHDDGDAAAFRTEADRIITEIELEGARGASLLPGTGRAMSSLRAHGYRVAIVTRNSRAVLATIPGTKDLACGALLSREAVARVKPHPEHLTAALAAVRCQAAHAAMVGDHPMDIAAGKALGMFTIGVLSGAGTRETLAAAGADLIVESVVALANMLVSPAPAPVPGVDRDEGGND